LSAIFLGTLAATGGLVLRDVLAGQSPNLLRPGVINGAAAFVGAIVFTLTFQFTELPPGLEQVITVCVVFAVRMLAIWRGWSTQPTRDISDAVWDRLGLPEPGAPKAVPEVDEWTW
jgi:hypothetical protein